MPAATADLAPVVREQLRQQALGRSGRGRRLRLATGLTVRELGQLLGVDGATLSRWEGGRVMPRGGGGRRWLEFCDLVERELSEQEREATAS